MLSAVGCDALFGISVHDVLMLSNSIDVSFFILVVASKFTTLDLCVFPPLKIAGVIAGSILSFAGNTRMRGVGPFAILGYSRYGHLVSLLAHSVRVE